MKDEGPSQGIMKELLQDSSLPLLPHLFALGIVGLRPSEASGP